MCLLCKSHLNFFIFILFYFFYQKWDKSMDPLQLLQTILIQRGWCYQTSQSLITSNLWQDQAEEASSGWSRAKRSGYQIETSHSATLILCNPLVTDTFRTKHAADHVNKLITVYLKKMSVVGYLFVAFRFLWVSVCAVIFTLMSACHLKTSEHVYYCWAEEATVTKNSILFVAR